jgi:hypothetical protein
VGASTSHKPMGLQGLLKGWLYITICTPQSTLYIQYSSEFSEQYRSTNNIKNKNVIVSCREWLRAGRNSSPGTCTIFSSPRRRDRSCGPHSFLSDGYGGLFPWGQSGRGLKLNTHLQLMLRSRKHGSIHPLPYKILWYSA